MIRLCKPGAVEELEMSELSIESLAAAVVKLLGADPSSSAAAAARSILKEMKSKMRNCGVENQSPIKLMLSGWPKKLPAAASHRLMDNRLILEVGKRG